MICHSTVVRNHHSRLAHWEAHGESGAFSSNATTEMLQTSHAYRLLANNGLEAVKGSTVKGFVHILNLKPHLWTTDLVLGVHQGVIRPQRKTTTNHKLRDFTKGKQKGSSVLT